MCQAGSLSTWALPIYLVRLGCYHGEDNIRRDSGKWCIMKYHVMKFHEDIK